MKPAFALDFRNDAVALLHRTSGGWHSLGRVTFYEPDLAGALSYLRSTALGLDPRGLATKLILPEDQVLFTTVDAPGPGDAAREAQIRQAIDGRTPYGLDDLVFDWEIVGDEVRVAVIARETLAEAEAFAAEHRFNPVSFAAAPQAGFDAEPWFGMSSLASSILAPGETVERDAFKVVLVERAPKAEADTDLPAVENPVPEAEQWQEPEPEPEPVAETVFEPAPVLEQETLAAPDTPHWADDIAPDANDLPPEPEAPALPVFDAPADPWPAKAEAEPEAYAPAAQELPLRDDPVFGLADDEPAPSAAFRKAAAPAEPTVAPIADTPLPTDLTSALQDIVLEEAPMALDVEDDTIQPQGLSAELPADDRPDTAREAPATGGAAGSAPGIGFASRRASADQGMLAKVPAPAARPNVSRPTAAKPLVGAPSKAEKTVVPRPTDARPVVDKMGKGLRGIGALVSAPAMGIGHKKPVEPISQTAGRKPVVAVAAPPGATPAPGAMANTLGQNIGRRSPPVGGKPRYLGLMLTLLLLVILAVIAAWSTTLAFRETTPDATQVASAESDIPAPEDEMAADGLDHEALADGQDLPPADAETVAEDLATALPEGETPIVTQPSADDLQAAAPAAPDLGAGDEIFLASKDLAPVVPDPAAVPKLLATSDPIPVAQAPPPPFGTVYQFDAKGLIVATPEGIITPEGVRLVAGKPPVLPKARPTALETAPSQPTVLPDSSGALAPAGPVGADPKLAGFRPKLRPESLTTTAVDPTTALALIDPATESRLAGKRPLARPAAVLAAGEAARAALGAAAASLAAQAEAEAAAKPGTSAVVISRRPEPRPRDLSRAVEAAVAAAVRTPEPQPEPEPEQTASLQPKPKPVEEAPPPKTKAKAPAPTEEEADEEPEVSTSAKKSSGSVAKQATFKNAINLSKTALIGVYGTQSKRYAMVRLSTGRYKKVRVGDTVDGGRVKAITTNEVRYQKGSKLVTLAMPNG
jgi:hypothetical protein